MDYNFKTILNELKMDSDKRYGDLSGLKQKMPAKGKAIIKEFHDGDLTKEEAIKQLMDTLECKRGSASLMLAKD